MQPPLSWFTSETKGFLMRDELASKTRLVSFHLSAGDHRGLDRRSVATYSSLHPHRCLLLSSDHVGWFLLFSPDTTEDTPEICFSPKQGGTEVQNFARAPHVSVLYICMVEPLDASF